MKGDSKEWFVYLVACLDGSYYCGVTCDIEKRMRLHREGKGSRYVRARGFGKLLRWQRCLSHSHALRCEIAIKQLPRKEKLVWFDTFTSV